MRGGDRRGRARSASAHRKPHLKHKCFREGQGTAGLLVVLVRLGLMQTTQALSVCRDANAFAHLRGNRVGNIAVIELVENHTNRAGDRPRCQGPGRWVDRNGARGDALDVFPVNSLEGRVSELQFAAVGPHLTCEKKGLARSQDPLNRRELVLVFGKKRRGQELKAVGEGDLQAYTRSGTVCNQVSGGNLGEDRHVFTLTQGGQGREPTPVVVPARRHHEQVADRRNASTLERFRGLLGQAQGQGNIERAHDEHPATRLAPLCPPSHVSRSIEDDASRVDSS